MSPYSPFNCDVDEINSTFEAPCTSTSSRNGQVEVRDLQPLWSDSRYSPSKRSFANRSGTQMICQQYHRPVHTPPNQTVPPINLKSPTLNATEDNIETPVTTTVAPVLDPLPNLSYTCYDNQIEISNKFQEQQQTQSLNLISSDLLYSSIATNISASPTPEFVGVSQSTNCQYNSSHSVAQSDAAMQKLGELQNRKLLVDSFAASGDLLIPRVMDDCHREAAGISDFTQPYGIKSYDSYEQDGPSNPQKDCAGGEESKGISDDVIGKGSTRRKGVDSHQEAQRSDDDFCLDGSPNGLYDSMSDEGSPLVDYASGNLRPNVVYDGGCSKRYSFRDTQDGSNETSQRVAVQEFDDVNKAVETISNTIEVSRNAVSPMRDNLCEELTNTGEVNCGGSEGRRVSDSHWREACEDSCHNEVDKSKNYVSQVKSRDIDVTKVFRISSVEAVVEGRSSGGNVESVNEEGSGTQARVVDVAADNGLENSAATVLNQLDEGNCDSHLFSGDMRDVIQRGKSQPLKVGQLGRRCVN